MHLRMDCVRVFDHLMFWWIRASCLPSTARTHQMVAIILALRPSSGVSLFGSRSAIKFFFDFVKSRVLSQRYGDEKNGWRPWRRKSGQGRNIIKKLKVDHLKAKCVRRELHKDVTTTRRTRRAPCPCHERVTLEYKSWLSVRLLWRRQNDFRCHPSTRPSPSNAQITTCTMSAPIIWIVSISIGCTN